MVSVTCKICMASTWLLSRVRGSSRPILQIEIIQARGAIKGTSHWVILSVTVGSIRASTSLVVAKSTTS